jgi:DNA-binding IclR family transcriptional regulator
MKLELPTDRLLLQELAKGRNTGANIREDTDRHRSYVNRRLTQLQDYGLVRNIGNGVYEITERGGASLHVTEEYDEAEDFDAIVNDMVDRVTIHPQRIEIAEE